MCEQCLVEASYYGTEEDCDFVPGFVLMRAKKEYYDKETWPVGTLGLVETNEPSFVLSVEPVRDPIDGLTDEQAEVALEKPEVEAAQNLFIERSDQIDIDLRETAPYAEAIYRLIAAAMQAGFNPETGPRFSCWLCNHLAKWMESHPETLETGYNDPEESTPS